MHKKYTNGKGPHAHVGSLPNSPTAVSKMPLVHCDTHLEARRLRPSGYSAPPLSSKGLQ